MRALTAPQPQPFVTRFLRSRDRVTRDTPRYDFLAGSDGTAGVCDVDRLLFRDSRGVLCTVPYAACIEVRGQRTMIVIAEHDGRTVPQYQREAYAALSAAGRAQSAVVRREGTADTLPDVPRGGVCFVEEKRAGEPVSAGERRMLAGLADGAQRQEVWLTQVTAEGEVTCATSADGRYALTPSAFAAYVRSFRGY